MKVPLNRRLRLSLWPGPARRPCNKRPKSLPLPRGVCSMPVPHNRRLSAPLAARPRSSIMQQPPPVAKTRPEAFVP